ncbi:MAG: CotH kinase family protein, partial [Planctomycetales bacterium]|nr:CotH kinase family protein [Planctomycetales bacterium]
NPTFYTKFKQRLGELAETVFTEAVFGPKIQNLANTLEPEVRLRARLRGTDEQRAVAELQETMNAMLEHLKERRSYVLAALAEDK